MKFKLEKRQWSILLMLWIALAGFAQKNARLAGTVLSDTDGMPIIGANVFCKETKQGTITDLDGKFYFNNPKKIKTLRVSFVGYVTQNIQVRPGVPVVVSLKEDIALIDEVVVVGYGVQKKKEVTGAVGSVGAEELLTQV